MLAGCSSTNSAGGGTGGEGSSNLTGDIAAGSTGTMSQFTDISGICPSDESEKVSVGVVDGTPVLDLEYAEDVRAETDMNVVMTASQRFVEVQGTAEGLAFTRSELDALLDLAAAGIEEIVAAQTEMVAEPPRPRG